jgi:hypothetical protein
MTTTPLTVCYPEGGRHLLMRWWSDSDRGHVVLARSDGAMRLVAERIFQRHPYADLREYLDVEIVAPSRLLSALAAEHTRRETIETFRAEMTWRMREAVDAGRTLPAPFSVCGSYEPEEDLSTDDDTGWFKRSHYSCRNCKDGIILALSPEELHARYGAAWRALQPLPAHKPYRSRMQSRARVAGDDEPLWCACAEFGNHASGIVLREVDRVEAAEYRPAYLSEDALFFYRRIAEPDSSHLAAMLDAENAARKAAIRRHDEDRKAERAQEERDRIDRVIALFDTARVDHVDPSGR